MDPGTEMYEVYLIQVAGLVQEWLMEPGKWEWVLASLADKVIVEIKINSPLHECWRIMSITPIKVNDVILNNIY